MVVLYLSRTTTFCLCINSLYRPRGHLDMVVPYEVLPHPSHRLSYMVWARSTLDHFCLGSAFPLFFPDTLPVFLLGRFSTFGCSALAGFGFDCGIVHGLCMQGDAPYKLEVRTSTKFPSATGELAQNLRCRPRVTVCISTKKRMFCHSRNGLYPF